MTAIKKYSGQFRVRLPTALHRTLVKNAKEQNISLNTYIIYRLSSDDELERILIESGACSIRGLIDYYKRSLR